MALTILAYPVHRQMLPLMAFLTSSAVGMGFLNSNALALLSLHRRTYADLVLAFLSGTPAVEEAEGEALT